MRLDAGIVAPLVILIVAAVVAAWLLTGSWLVSGADHAVLVGSPPTTAAPEQ